MILSQAFSLQVLVDLLVLLYDGLWLNGWSDLDRSEPHFTATTNT